MIPMADKILIVDDDIESLKLIGLMLQRQGYEVIAANSGKQALSKVSSELPDLIILDVMMPDMSGYDVCRRIRSYQPSAETPIIMFTAKTLIDDKVAGFEAGADDYLTKPTHPAELAARIKNMLDTRRPAVPAQPEQSALTIGVMGSKGGVGTTTLALNIAASLMAQGHETIVTDLRLGSGSLGLMLGLGEACGMANVIAKDPTAITTELVQQELSDHQSGLRALLASSRPREAQVPVKADALKALFNALKPLADVVVYDLGTGYTRINAQILPLIDRLILLVEPFAIPLTITRQLIDEIEKSHRLRVEIVVITRSQSKMQIPWHQVEEQLSRPILAIVSTAPDMAVQSAEAHIPMVIMNPSAIVTNQITKLAEDIYGKQN